MWSVIIPVALTLLTWWSATGLILWLNRLDRRSFPVSLAGASGLLVAGLVGLQLTATDGSVAGSYLAFLSAILVWAWLEMTFLMGFITGPQRDPLPAGLGPRDRFQQAVRTIIWHELAILVLGLFVAALTMPAQNPFGLLTFLVLWVMRLSAKLNLFLGVPNVGEQYLPSHLAYLGSYFRRRPMNMLFPLSVAAGGWLAFELARRARAADGAGEEVGYTIVATLTALAVLEHGFMVLPLQSDRLWRWSLAVRQREAWRGTPAPAPDTAHRCREDVA